MANTGNVAWSGTLTQGTAATVTILEARENVRVINNSVTGVYFTIASDNATPTAATVAGEDNYLVPGVVGAYTTVKVGTPPTILSIICSGPAGITVQTNNAD